MITYYCGQRGCEFESESKPEHCPVCNNPFIFNSYKTERVSDKIIDTVPETVQENITVI